jgi:hypothetical protein
MTRRLVALAAATLFSLSCGGGGGDAPGEPTTPTAPAAPQTPVVDERAVAAVAATPTSVSLEAGATAALTAVATNANGAVLSAEPITWASSDTTRATITAAGVLSGVAPGGATVTATAGGKQATVAVTVTAPRVASVRAGAAAITVAAGTTAQITAQAADARGVALAGRPVAWTSSAPGVATVAASTAGDTVTVTGVAPGTATVTATSEGKTATVTVTVTEPRLVVVSVTELKDFAPVAINDAGKIAGTRPATVTPSGLVRNRVTVWENGTFRPALPPLPLDGPRPPEVGGPLAAESFARGMNEAGTVAGRLDRDYYSSGSAAFGPATFDITPPAPTLTGASTAFGSGGTGGAHAINASGTVAGWRASVAGATATLYGPGARELPAPGPAQVNLPGPEYGVSSEALGINDRGQVVGIIGTTSVSLPNDEPRARAGYALLWDAGGVRVLGGGPGGASQVTAFACAINNRGQIAGYLSTATSVKGVRWEPDGTITELTVPTGYTSFTGCGINDAGDIAGAVVAADATHAAVWSNGRITVLDATPGLRSTAVDINNRGAVGGTIGDPGFAFYGTSGGLGVRWTLAPSDK